MNTNKIVKDLRAQIDSNDEKIGEWEALIDQAKAEIEKRNKIDEELREEIRTLRGDSCDCYSFHMENSCNHSLA